MSFEERCELLKQMRLKRIKSRDLSVLCGCSNSWISQWFNKPEIELSQDMQSKIIDYIYQK